MLTRCILSIFCLLRSFSQTSAWLLLLLWYVRSPSPIYCVGTFPYYADKLSSPPMLIVLLVGGLPTLPKQGDELLMDALAGIRSAGAYEEVSPPRRWQCGWQSS